jgi:hypothetical protein
MTRRRSARNDLMATLRTPLTHCGFLCLVISVADRFWPCA